MDKLITRINQPSYPPRDVLERYLDYLYDGQKCKENGWLQLELEQTLAKKLNSKHVFFTANGTMALLLALLSIEKKGTIILSAFGHPATVNAVIAAGFKPMFCDIESKNLCLDPSLLVDVIDGDTVAILATHIYGNACNHDALTQIADNANLVLMYDASHAFGSVWKNKSLVTYGDVTALSLQAFKVLSSIEGGVILTDDDGIAERIYRHRFFGKNKNGSFVSFGLNGKGSDLHAAVALANLEQLDETVNKRKANFLSYKTKLKNDSCFSTYEYQSELTPNYSYLPLIFNDFQKSEVVINALRESYVIARRYFYPSLNTLPFLDSSLSCPVSESVSKRVVCIPVHQEITSEDVHRIAAIVNGNC